MKRALRAYMEFQIETDQEVTELIPSVGGYALSDDKVIMLFDFEETSFGATREGNIVKFSTEQKTLDFDLFKEYWIHNGFISIDTPDNEIESLIFDFIKNSTGIDELYLSVFTGEDDNFFEGEVTITSFFILDIINSEVVNILDRKVNYKACIGTIVNKAVINQTA